MTGVDPTALTGSQLGVAVVTVTMLAAAVVALWKALGAERKARVEDLKMTLPALAAAAEASKETAELGARMLNRERERLGYERDGRER